MMDILRSLLVAALSLLGLGTPDTLESDSALFAARTISCSFVNHASMSVWRFDLPRLSVVDDGASQNFVLDAMDLKKGTARMVATANPNGGAANVQIWAGATGLHTLETPMASVILTTISSFKTKSGFFPAVTSRHSGFLVFAPSQYYGTCTILEGGRP